MPDLRDALERRSLDFDIEPGFYERTLERRDTLRRRRRIAAGAVALLVALAGMSAAYVAIRADGGTPAVRPVIVTPPPTIPEGIYWTRPLTRDEVMQTILDEGYTRKLAREHYFDHIPIFTSEVQQGLLLQDGFWIQTARVGSGEQEAGWSGTYEVTGPNRVVARGYGCTITYRYALSGETLTLEVLAESGDSPDCGAGDLIAQTAIFESAPFVRDR